jgi:hypothetical protein
MRKILFLLSISVLSVTAALCMTHIIHAEEPVISGTQTENLRIVETYGEAVFGEDTTKAQAKAAARNNARIRALEEAVGVQMRGSTVLYNSSLISDLVVTATKGLIVREEIIEDNPKVKDDQISYYYKLRAYIKPINIEKRGDFKILKAEVVRADSDRRLRYPVFQHDDEIQVRIRVNNDSYINIFSVSQDGMVSKLFPNKYFKSAMLAAKETMVFPDNTQRALGLKLRVKTPKKLSKAIESVLVIATREKVEFLTDETIESPMITDLMRELSEIDPSLWAEKTVGYEVRK